MLCPNCGKEMCWQSDYTFDDLGYEGDGVVTFMECFKCGTTVEIGVPTVNPYEKKEGEKEDGTQ